MTQPLTRPSLSRDISDLIFPIELDVSTDNKPFAHSPIQVEERHQQQNNDIKQAQVKSSDQINSSATPSLTGMTSIQTIVEDDVSSSDAWLQQVNCSTADSDQLIQDIGLDAINAGYSATVLRQGGYSARELRDHGFFASELKEAGFDARELSDAGYKLYELELAGYSLQ